MNTSTPKISVLMSVYNGSVYLRESIESILNQTFTDFEFIIINDCSTDNSWEIINEYAEKDSRIVLVNNEENIGLTKSLNKGLNIAKGEYIARQDADDISFSQRFEKQVLLLDKHLEVALASCEIEYINPEGGFIGKDLSACAPDLVAWYLLFFNRLSGHSQVVFRKKLVLDLGGYCESYRYSQDYELWCRIVKIRKIFILPEVLLQQRRHNQSISLVKSSEQEAYVINQVKQNIHQLIGKEISFEEALFLKEFWMEYGRTKTIPVNKKLIVTHNLMKEITRAFVNRKTSNSISKSELSKELQTLTGNQFIAWMKTLSNKDEFIAKIYISLYTLMWYPLGLVKYYIKGIKNLLLRIVGKLKFKAIIKANT